MESRPKSGPPGQTPEGTRELERRLRASEEQGRRNTTRLRVLSDVTQVFAEATTDYERLVETVVELVAEMIGDMCFLRLLSDDGTLLLPIASYDPDPAARELLREKWATVSVRADEPWLNRRVLETGLPLRMSGAPLEEIYRAANSELSGFFEALKPRSLLAVPLRARGRAIGILYLIRHKQETFVFDDEDQRLATDLANRAALAVENAHLFSGLEERVKSRTTELEAANQALARSEANFRTLIETAPEAIAVHRNDKFVYVNPRFAGLIGSSRSEELIGHPVLEVIHPEDRSIAFEHLQAIEHQTKPIAAREFRIVRKDGGVAWAEVTGLPVSFDGIPAVMTYTRDLTVQRQMQSRLLLSDRMASMGTLAAGVAHEINNPLAYVKANLDLIVEELRADGLATDPSRSARLTQMVGDARQGVARVQKIVGDLKRFSRADDETRATLELSRVLSVAVSMTANEIRHRARLVEHYGNAPLVEADESRLAQVFINLLVNAAQAVPEGHTDRNEIEITTSTDSGGYAVVTIRDTGTGIEPAIMGRIFDPFFTTKPVGSGTGLGLSICHGIVTGLGGEIEVETELGSGTTFRVLLPPARRPPATPVPLSRPAALPTRRGAVLIIDDDPLVAGSLRRVLCQAHDITVVSDGREAIQRIVGGQHFDLVLCDLMMPEMSGMALFEELGKIAPRLADRIVFITGGAFTPEAKRFLEEHETRVVEKPFELGALRALVAAAIE
jgi:PAS domain S-box-containing protein